MRQRRQSLLTWNKNFKKKSGIALKWKKKVWPCFMLELSVKLILLKIRRLLTAKKSKNVCSINLLTLRTSLVGRLTPMANRISAYTRQRQRLVLEASDFSGGFFPQLTDYDMNTRFVRDIQNMELVNGFWQKRKGFHLAGEFDSVRSTPNTAKGLFVFNQLGTTHILGVFNNDLYVKRHFSGSNYGRKVYSKVHEIRRVRFTEYRSNCYIAHGKENLLKYDGDDVYE